MYGEKKPMVRFDIRCVYNESKSLAGIQCYTVRLCL